MARFKSAADAELRFTIGTEQYVIAPRETFDVPDQFAHLVIERGLLVEALPDTFRVKVAKQLVGALKARLPEASVTLRTNTFRGAVFIDGYVPDERFIAFADGAIHSKGRAWGVVLSGYAPLTLTYDEAHRRERIATLATAFLEALNQDVLQLGARWFADPSSLVCVRRVMAAECCHLERVPEIGEIVSVPKAYFDGRAYGDERDTFEVVDGLEFGAH